MGVMKHHALQVPCSHHFWVLRSINSTCQAHGHCSFAVVQPLGHVQLFAALWTAAHQPSLSLTISQSLPIYCIFRGEYDPTKTNETQGEIDWEP